MTLNIQNTQSVLWTRCICTKYAGKEISLCRTWQHNTKKTHTQFFLRRKFSGEFTANGFRSSVVFINRIWQQRKIRMHAGRRRKKIGLTLTTVTTLVLYFVCAKTKELELCVPSNCFLPFRTEQRYVWVFFLVFASTLRNQVAMRRQCCFNVCHNLFHFIPVWMNEIREERVSVAARHIASHPTL